MRAWLVSVVVEKDHAGACFDVSFAKAVGLVEGWDAFVEAVENVGHVGGFGFQVEHVCDGFGVVKVLLLERFLLGHEQCQDVFAADG